MTFTPNLCRESMINTAAPKKRPNFKRFEFEQNPNGANYIIVDLDSWTVSDCGFGSCGWIGCGVKLTEKGKRLSVKVNGAWAEIHADVKRL